MQETTRYTPGCNGSAHASSGMYRIAPNSGIEGGQQAYSLFPNPNQGSFTIRQQAAEDKAVRLKVYNALGMEVYQSSAHCLIGNKSERAGTSDLLLWC